MEYDGRCKGKIIDDHWWLREWLLLMMLKNYDCAGWWYGYDWYWW